MFQAEDPILECVPNFSEGRDPAVIEAIAASIRSVSGVRLLHTDAGYDANRTVYTFAGLPEAVCEAAYQAIKTAAGLIDMRRHQGAHPRMGACDVCPLIPVRNISVDETVTLSRNLGQRIGELGIPVYLYENSAARPERRSLAYLRKGEYEAIPDKISRPEWTPDFGPSVFHETFGMMALGARPFLIAYNVNLNTDNVAVAQAIAVRVRESGNGQRPGLLKNVRAIGWYMDEYRCAQVSCNLTDFEITPLKTLFDTITFAARELGTDTAGSELIGLIPERALLDGFSTAEAAVTHLGLNSVTPFDANERILERVLFRI